MHQFLLISSDFRKGKTTAAKKNLQSEIGWLARFFFLRSKKRAEMNTRPPTPGAARWQAPPSRSA
jgi:hypothetical protein